MHSRIPGLSISNIYTLDLTRVAHSRLYKYIFQFISALLLELLQVFLTLF